MNKMLALIRRISRRKAAYRATFLDADGELHPNAKKVLADLSRFCRATDTTCVVSPTTKTIDPLAMAMAEGRREVWNRITAHLYLNDEVKVQLKEDNQEEYR